MSAAAMSGQGGGRESEKVRQLENDLAQERRIATILKGQVADLQLSLGKAQRELSDCRLCASPPTSSRSMASPPPPPPTTSSTNVPLRARPSKELQVDAAHQEIETLQERVESLERENAASRREHGRVTALEGEVIALLEELRQKEQFAQERAEGSEDKTFRSQPAIARGDSFLSQTSDQAPAEALSERLRQENAELQRRHLDSEAELAKMTKEAEWLRQVNAAMETRFVQQAKDMEEWSALMEAKVAEEEEEKSGTGRAASPRESLASEISLSEEVDQREDAKPNASASPRLQGTLPQIFMTQAASQRDLDSDVSEFDRELEHVRFEYLQLQTAVSRETLELRSLVVRQHREVSAVHSQNMQLKQELGAEGKSLQALIAKLEKF